MPGPDRDVERAEAARLLDAFRGAGAKVVETDILLPAGTLLDLYGEDIRARAFMTHDPVRGELMLRPDFTVPLAEAHIGGPGGPARYAYRGRVFRQQDGIAGRPAEYLQVGIEMFDSEQPELEDAEIFALFQHVLSPLDLVPATGDIGILTAAVAGLSCSPRRRAALMRHRWRPRRFRALLDRFADPGPSRRRLPREAEVASSPSIGRRSAEEVRTRLRALSEEEAEPPIAAAEVQLLSRIGALNGLAANVLSELRELQTDAVGLAHAVERFARRLDALDRAGIDADTLSFEGSYGRTSMEYYDGFVFGFRVAGRPELPPVATGGRYDALTAALGGAGTRAIGGVVRPAMTGPLRHGGGT